jgi:hypothetical protein
MADNQDITSAHQTFSGFAALMKWGTIISALVAFFVILLIAPGK